MASSTPAGDIQVEEVGPQKFALTIIFDGQRFDCGLYVNRVSALQAGRLFIERKEGERVGQRKHPRKKKPD